MPITLLEYAAPVPAIEFLSLDVPCSIHLEGKAARLRVMKASGPVDRWLSLYDHTGWSHRSAKPDTTIAAGQPFALELRDDERISIRVDQAPREAQWHYFCENCHFQLCHYQLDITALASDFEKAGQRFWQQQTLHNCPRCRAQASLPQHRRSNPASGQLA